MCGRTCLTLSPEEISTACIHKQKPNDIYSCVPEFRCEYNLGKKYQPSYNIAPTDITPVLVSADHFSTDDNDKQKQTDYYRLLCPMMWGMIPFWHCGNYKKHGLSTNNCRFEGLQQSKLYNNSLEKGQRCVILAEGFYEWQTTKTNVKLSSERDAYYIYMPQTKNGSSNIKKEIDTAAGGEDKNNKNMNLLKMAGLFDIWTDENGDNIFSYSIITYESNDHFSWLHHRIPAILETDQQVDDWLDYKRVPGKEALTLLKPNKIIQWHRVSNLVNNSRNKSDQCNKSIESIKKESRMLNWLIPKKKIKIENENDINLNEEKKE